MTDVAVAEIEPSTKYQETVREVIESLREKNKAVLVCGATQSGKTSLAMTVTQQLRGTEIFFTTPAVQETLGAIQVVDRTGVKFEKLPPANQMKNFDGTVIIVIDEISTRGPIYEEL